MIKTWTACEKVANDFEQSVYSFHPCQCACLSFALYGLQMMKNKILIYITICYRCSYWPDIDIWYLGMSSIVDKSINQYFHFVNYIESKGMSSLVDKSINRHFHFVN